MQIFTFASGCILTPKGGAGPNEEVKLWGWPPWLRRALAYFSIFRKPNMFFFFACLSPKYFLAHAMLMLTETRLNIRRVAYFWMKK